MTLGEFLKEQGVHGDPWHCSSMPADWAMTQGHPDFASAWRSPMTDEEYTQASAGGLVGLWEAGIDGRIPATSEYKDGDIGVISFLGHETGGIFVNGKWAIRAERGLGFIASGRLAVLKAWHV